MKRLKPCRFSRTSGRTLRAKVMSSPLILTFRKKWKPLRGRLSHLTFYLAQQDHYRIKG
jgi:hypothetical protein